MQDDNSADLTGTFVDASRRVAVLCGNSHTNVGPATNAEMLIEQVPPVHTYGTVFIIPTIPGRSGSSKVKVLAQDDLTRVTSTSGENTVLSKARYITWDVPASGYTIISASKPVLVGLFVSSSQGRDQGKPAMMIIPPVQQYLNDYKFVVPDMQGETVYLIIVTQPASTQGLLLDGRPVDSSSWRPIRGPITMSGTYLTVRPGSHRLYHSSSDPRVTFGAFLYGFSPQRCGFAYAVGTCLDPLSQVSIPVTVLPSFMVGGPM